jgi:hypothetical protein
MKRLTVAITILALGVVSTAVLAQSSSSDSTSGTPRYLP